MRQIFESLREQIKDNSTDVGSTKIITMHNARTLVNKAEHKWESDYCTTWKIKENDLFMQIHGTCYLVDEVKYWKCCPYCCKKLKLEVR